MTGTDVRNKRLKLDLSQDDFWGPLGLSQSAGSRYESGRTIPDPVRNLLVIAYGTARDSDGVVAILRKYK